jgi:hypothetical protein
MNAILTKTGSSNGGDTDDPATEGRSFRAAVFGLSR